MCECKKSSASAAESQSIPADFVHVEVRWYNGAEGEDWNNYTVVGPSLDDVVTSVVKEVAPGFVDRLRWNTAKQLAQAFGSSS